MNIIGKSEEWKTFSLSTSASFRWFSSILSRSTNPCSCDFFMFPISTQRAAFSFSCVWICSCALSRLACKVRFGNGKKRITLKLYETVHYGCKIIRPISIPFPEAPPKFVEVFARQLKPLLFPFCGIFALFRADFQFPAFLLLVFCILARFQLDVALQVLIGK